MASKSIYINGDIAALICEELRDQSLLATLNSLSPVSKLWYDVAVPKLYVGLVFNFLPKRMFWNKRALGTLESNARARLALCHLTVRRGPRFPFHGSPDYVVSLEILKRLSVVIPLCQNLKIFEWSISNSIPDEVVQSLSIHPRLQKLHLIAPSLGPKEDSIVEFATDVRAKNKVTSLQVVIGGDYAPYSLPDDFLEYFRSSGAPGFHTLIINLPDLVTLDLGYNGVGESIPFSAITSQRFPSIASLTLRHWSFTNDDKKSIQHHLNLAALRHLTISFGTDVDKFFTSLIAHNTQLKSLTVTSIEPVGERSELRTFLASQESLKSLNLSCKNLPFSVLLDYLRLNLKTLTRLIWTEDLPESGKRVPFSPFELEAIRDSCPDLDNLSMFLPVEDLDLSKSPILPILKSFPNLDYLAIHSYQERVAGTEGYHFQDPMTVGLLAEAIRGPRMKDMSLQIFGPDFHTEYTDQNATGRKWLVNYSNTSSPSGFRVVDLTERKFERWSERHCRAMGKEYVPPQTREEKRQDWVKAIEWFESHQGDEISES